MNTLKSHITLLWCASMVLIQSCQAKPAAEIHPSFARDSSGIYREAQEQNLKGRVKSIGTWLYKGASNTKETHYENYPRDFHIPIDEYYEYNRDGNLILRNHAFRYLDSINQAVKTIYNEDFVYIPLDSANKSNYNPRMYIPYPAYNPYLVKLSNYNNADVKYPQLTIHNLDSCLKKDMSIYGDIYIYIYDKKNRIYQEVLSIPAYQYGWNKKEITLKDIDKKNIYFRTTYEYDKQDRITAQKIIIREADREPPVVLSWDAVHGVDVSIYHEVQRTFQYDEQGRLKNVSAYQKKQLIFSETYTYAPQGYISEVKRFIISDLTHHWFPADNVIEKYDENGHLTEAQELTDKGAVTKTRYYEYTLDTHKNWVECRMYLEGRTQEPTLTARRIIEYYKD